MKRFITMFLALVMVAFVFVGCDVPQTDTSRQKEVARNLEEAQPTPTDIEYSLERYNLIRRAYWVNGMEERARTLECPVEKPLGYVVLIVEGVGVMGTYVVDGKVSSLNSYLTPDSERYAGSSVSWLADVDGTYGSNDNGIFFFTVDGNYMEWTGTYLYSDIPFHVDEPILKVQEGK